MLLFFFLSKKIVLRIRCFWFCNVYLLLFSDFYPGPTATHLPLSTFTRQTGRDVRTGNGSLNLVGEIRRDEEGPPESRHGDHDFTPWRHELRNEHVRERRPREFSPISNFSISRHRRTRATDQRVQGLHLDNVIEMLRRFRRDVTCRASHAARYQLSNLSERSDVCTYLRCKFCE